MGKPHRGLQCTAQGARTKPEASTKEWRGLMIMSGVGTTYGMGAATGKRSGSHSATGMLYFTACASAQPDVGSEDQVSCFWSKPVRA